MPWNDFKNLLDGPLCFAGQLLTTEFASVIRTGLNQSAAVIGGGQLVVLSTVGDRCIALPTGSGNTPLGIALLPTAMENVAANRNASNDLGYPQYDTVSYVVRGTIAVRVTTNVTKGGQAFWIATPGGGELAGQFRADANAGAAVALANSRFEAAGVAGALVPLTINLA